MQTVVACFSFICLADSSQVNFDQRVRTQFRHARHWHTSQIFPSFQISMLGCTIEQRESLVGSFTQSWQVHSFGRFDRASWMCIGTGRPTRSIHELCSLFARAFGSPGLGARARSRTGAVAWGGLIQRLVSSG